MKLFSAMVIVMALFGIAVGAEAPSPLAESCLETIPDDPPGTVFEVADATKDLLAMMDAYGVSSDTSGFTLVFDTIVDHVMSADEEIRPLLAHVLTHNAQIRTHHGQDEAAFAQLLEVERLLVSLAEEIDGMGLEEVTELYENDPMAVLRLSFGTNAAAYTSPIAARLARKLSEAGLDEARKDRLVAMADTFVILEASFAGFVARMDEATSEPDPPDNRS